MAAAAMLDGDAQTIRTDLVDPRELEEALAPPAVPELRDLELLDASELLDPSELEPSPLARAVRASATAQRPAVRPAVRPKAPSRPTPPARATATRPTAPPLPVPPSRTPTASQRVIMTVPPTLPIAADTPPLAAPPAAPIAPQLPQRPQLRLPSQPTVAQPAPSLPPPVVPGALPPPSPPRPQAVTASSSSNGLTQVVRFEGRTVGRALRQANLELQRWLSTAWRDLRGSIAEARATSLGLPIVVGAVVSAFLFGALAVWGARSLAPRPEAPPAVHAAVVTQLPIVTPMPIVAPAPPVVTEEALPPPSAAELRAQKHRRPAR